VETERLFNDLIADLERDLCNTIDRQPQLVAVALAHPRLARSLALAATISLAGKLAQVVLQEEGESARPKIQQMTNALQLLVASPPNAGVH
jgi:hypothetical protein